MVCSHHRASPAAPLQPLALPGGHAGGLQLLPDQALLRPVLHLLQPAQSLLALHVPAAGRQHTSISLRVSKHVRERVFHHIYPFSTVSNRYFPASSTDTSGRPIWTHLWPMPKLSRARWPMANIKTINVISHYIFSYLKSI